MTTFQQSSTTWKITPHKRRFNRLYISFQIQPSSLPSATFITHKLNKYIFYEHQLAHCLQADNWVSNII